MFKNSVSSEFKFGKHKSKKISQVIIEEPDYVSWCIENLDSFYITFNFIRDAVMLNNDFYISNRALTELEDKMKKLNEIQEEELEEILGYETGTYKFNNQYKDWLNPEKKISLIEEEKIRRIEARNKAEEYEIMQNMYRREREEIDSSNAENCDWSNYNND